MSINYTKVPAGFKEKKYDDRSLDVIAQDMLDWCLTQECQKLGETDKEFRVQCPNISCPSRQKSESHKAFDINKDSAQYHCWHCGLKGQGLHGSKGLIATLENGDFSPSAFNGNPNITSDNSFFKPKEKTEAVMSKDELPPIAQALCKEARAYFIKRCIPENVYGDFGARIFSAPVGTQLSFMKQPLKDAAIFFPIRNDEGDIVHVHYKLIHGGYYMSPGVKPIYLTKATALNTIVIVEGVFDALSVYTSGYQGAALLGHEITSNHDLSVFEGKRVVIMLDNDDAGKTSISPIASVLASVAKEVKIAEIPPELGKDANDVLMKAGKDKLNELIQNAVVYVENVGHTSHTTDTTTEIKQDSNLKVETTPMKLTEDKPKKKTLPSVDILRELNQLHMTDTGNADGFALLNGDDFRYDWNRKRWLYWDGVRWCVDSNSLATQAIKEMARARLAAAALIDDDEQCKKMVKWAFNSEAKYRLKSALELAQSEPPFPASTEQFDKDPYLLGCANGVMNLQTGEFREGRRDDYIMKSTNLNYNPTAECPRWIQFLDEVFLGNTELIDFIHRAVGYSLTADASEQCLFICYGTGWNGKSKFLIILRDLLGDYAKNTPFSTFTNRYRDTATNDLATLAGVRSITSSEISEGQGLNEARVKAMTGGDPITARFLYGEYFDYIPAYKVWLAVNHKPLIKGTDEGIWRRIRLIPFEASFKANPDPYIEEKLKAEIEGILRWAVDGCLKWQRERLEMPEKVEAATNEYRQESDVIAQFLSDCTVETENAKVKASDLYKAYEAWCGEIGEEAITGTAFGRRVREKGYEKVKKQYVHYLGIGLLDSLETV